MDNDYDDITFNLVEQEMCKSYVLKRADGKPLTLNHTEFQIQEIALAAANAHVKELVEQGKIVNKNINLPSYTITFEMSDDNLDMYIQFHELCVENLTKEQFMILSYVFGKDRIGAKPN